MATQGVLRVCDIGGVFTLYSEVAKAIVNSPQSLDPLCVWTSRRSNTISELTVLTMAAIWRFTLLHVIPDWKLLKMFTCPGLMCSCIYNNYYVQYNI